MTTSTQTIIDAVVAALKAPVGGNIAAKAGNTGNGVFNALQVAAPAALGIYVATFTDATHYGVKAPDNSDAGNGTIGQGFTLDGGGLYFESAAGSIAFMAGDAFAITTLAATAAATKVFAPSDWPNKAEEYPLIQVYWPEESKESWGPNAPAYNVTTVVRIVAKVAALPGKGDAGAQAALAAVDLLKRQIEVAVVNNAPLYRIISEIASIDSKCEVKAEGELSLGEVTMDFAVKYPQTTEDFNPVVAWPLGTIAIYADLLNVADPSGTYTPPFDYAVTPAPRTVGPDGRVEAGAVLNLET